LNISQQVLPKIILLVIDFKSLLSGKNLGLKKVKKTDSIQRILIKKEIEPPLSRKEAIGLRF